MIDITKLLEIIKKQGATGVLAMWLWYTHSEVQELKQRLYDCYGKKALIEQTKKNKQGLFNNFYAILPKNELEDETI
jgi:hypothetical protein